MKNDATPEDFLRYLDEADIGDPEGDQLKNPVVLASACLMLAGFLLFQAGASEQQQREYIEMFLLGAFGPKPKH